MGLEVRSMTKKFTLIELLVVVAIIGILASILLPSLQKSRVKATHAVCKSNQRQLGIALNMYTDDNEEYFAHSGWAGNLSGQKGWLYSGNNKDSQDDVETGALWPYLTSYDSYRCPAHEKKTYGTQRVSSYIMSGAVNDYGYGDGKPFKMSQIRNDFIVLWEGNEHHEGNMWNDSSDYPWEDFSGNEKLTLRHLGLSSIVAVDGSVEVITNIGFKTEVYAEDSRIDDCATHGGHK